MFLVDPADVIAVHRAHTLNGRDGALAEVRRRWPALAERALPGVLDRVLKLKVEALPEAMRRDVSAVEGERLRQRECDRERLRRARIKSETD